MCVTAECDIELQEGKLVLLGLTERLPLCNRPVRRIAPMVQIIGHKRSLPY
jgi:hypothetical protein